MDDEKLEKAKSLQNKIENVSTKLGKFRAIGREGVRQKKVSVSGCDGYSAEDLLSEQTLKTIKLIVVVELEDILRELEWEYEAL